MGECLREQRENDDLPFAKYQLALHRSLAAVDLCWAVQRTALSRNPNDCDCDEDRSAWLCPPPLWPCYSNAVSVLVPPPNDR